MHVLFLDNHDLISLKLYELTVERSPEEEEEQQEITLPSVDYRVDPNGNTVTKRLYLHYMFHIRYFAEEYKWLYLTKVFFTQFTWRMKEEASSPSSFSSLFLLLHWL